MLKHTLKYITRWKPKEYIEQRFFIPSGQGTTVNFLGRKFHVKNGMETGANLQMRIYQTLKTDVMLLLKEVNEL